MTYFLFTSPILLKCQYLPFNQNDLQMELLQIYVTFYTN